MKTAPNPLEAAVLQSGLATGTRILVAVSGGPDSVALLHTLYGVSRETSRSWTLRIGHVNHGLRAEESQLDERFVRSLGERLQVQVEVSVVDTSAYARRHHLSLEAAARELRYRELRSMLAAWPGDLIATGHTMEDQAETVLLHLTRGAGIVGLGGMQDRSADLVRPFLHVRRETILEVVQEHRMPYRLDSSNVDPRFARNRVRREVLPALETVQADPVEILSRTARMLRGDAAFLLQEAGRTLFHLEVVPREGAIGASLRAWSQLHPSLQRHTLRLLVEELLGHSRDLDERHVSDIVTELTRNAGTERVLDRLPHGLVVYADALRFELCIQRRTPQAPLRPVELSVPGSAWLEVGKLTAAPAEVKSREELDRLVAVSGPFHAYCDADALGTSLLIRSRLAGDRIALFGMDGMRKLQDILVDRRVPRAERDRIPVVTNGRHPVWVPGFTLDRRVAVGAETRPVIHLHFEPTHQAPLP